MSKETLFELIKNDESIKQYKRLEQIINSDSELLNQVMELKELQKELINLKHLDKSKMALLVEKQYNEKLESINNNPLLHNYLELQFELNELLQEIKTIIENGLKIETKYR